MAAISEYVNLRISFLEPKKIIDFEKYLKYPPEVQVEHKTYSTICGTPVQVILDQNNLTGLAGGVIEGQNMAQNAADAVNPMQNCWLQSPVEAPEWLKDTKNGPQAISPITLSLFRDP